MKPIKFRGMNVTFAENQPEYLPLPALVADMENGGQNVISCWKLTWWERITVLFTGVMWINSLKFDHALQPVLPETTRPFTITVTDDD
jgi:hypothetical protein